MWRWRCCWEWWVKKICLQHVPALKKKGEEEHEYCSQQGHYRASHLTLLLFPLSVSLSLFSGGRVSVCLWENRTPRSVYSISTGGRAFIPEITGMRVPLVYFLCRRHFTSHQRMQSNHTQPLTPLYTTTCSVTLSLSRSNIFSRRKLVLLVLKNSPNPSLDLKKNYLMLGMDTSLNFCRTFASIYNSCVMTVIHKSNSVIVKLHLWHSLKTNLKHKYSTISTPW